MGLKGQIGAVRVNTPEWFGWPRYVVPNWALRAELLANVKPAINAELHGGNDRPNEYFKENGWRGALANRAGSILRATEDSVVRRLNDVMKGKTRILNANMAEALFMAVDLNMDESTVPTLPGSKLLAHELIYTRMQAAVPKARPEEAVPFIAQTIELAAQIVQAEDIERLPMLLDEAPFDCFRPWS